MEGVRRASQGLVSGLRPRASQIATSPLAPALQQYVLGRLCIVAHPQIPTLFSELGALLCLKSKYNSGGEFEPDWLVVIGPVTFLHAHTPHRKPPGCDGSPGGDGGPPVPHDTAILVSPQ